MLKPRNCGLTGRNTICRDASEVCNSYTEVVNYKNEMDIKIVPFHGQYIATDITKRLPGNITLGPFAPLSGTRGLQAGGGPGFIGGGVNCGASVYLYHHYRQFQWLLDCKSGTNCSNGPTDEAHACNGCCPTFEVSP